MEKIIKKSCLIFCVFVLSCVMFLFSACETNSNIYDSDGYKNSSGYYKLKTITKQEGNEGQVKGYYSYIFNYDPVCMLMLSSSNELNISSTVKDGSYALTIQVTITDLTTNYKVSSKLSQNYNTLGSGNLIVEAKNFDKNTNLVFASYSGNYKSMAQNMTINALDQCLNLLQQKLNIFNFSVSDIGFYRYV